MKEAVLEALVCPACHDAIEVGEVFQAERHEIKEGSLRCAAGKHHFAITRFVPRFVATEGTTSSFGFEWNKHPKTQLDSANGLHISRDRFRESTNWPANLSGKSILEVGSGAGRFTEIALQSGATVFSVDASRAVDANWSNNGHHPNLVLCQANLYELPFREGTFDYVFCFGVLQHTPDVAKSFLTLAKYPKPGGALAVDVYNRDYWRNYHTPMYLLRPLTRHIPSDTLYRWVSGATPALMRTSSRLRRVPGIGRQLSALVPIANYEGLLPAEAKDMIRQQSVLDTFDTLSPRYISPQSPRTVARWFAAAGYADVEYSNDAVFFMRGRRERAASGRPAASIEQAPPLGAAAQL